MLRPVRLVRGRRRRAVKTEEDGKTGEGVDGEDDGDNANDQISSLTKEGEGDGEGEGDPNKPKADLNKIAPFGGAGQPRKPVQKKKMKTYILSAKDEENWKRENLDRYPWVLTDFDNVPEKTYEGKLDGEIGDQYVLFVFSVSIHSIHIKLLLLANAITKKNPHRTTDSKSYPAQNVTASTNESTTQLSRPKKPTK